MGALSLNPLVVSVTAARRDDSIYIPYSSITECRWTCFKTPSNEDIFAIQLLETRAQRRLSTTQVDGN